MWDMGSQGEFLLNRVVRPCYRRLKGTYSSFNRRGIILLNLARMELLAGPSAPVSLRRRLWLWRRGFTSRTDMLLDITEENYTEYLSEYQESVTHTINGRWRAAMDNKLTSYLLLQPFDEHLPALYGVAENGVVRRYPTYESSHTDPPVAELSADGGFSGFGRFGGFDGFKEFDAVEYLDDLLDTVGTAVLKPVFGSGGRGVCIVSRGERAPFEVNGEPYSRRQFAELVSDLDQSLVTEYIEQSAFMDELYPRSTNSVRILTMWDYEANEPFVALAFARVGSEASAPLDNLHQGGLLVGVDHETGELVGASAISDMNAPSVEHIETHPTTGARLVGRSIPGWESIADEVVRMASGVPQLRYIGWDVLPTDDGFRVLEVNSAPDVLSPQIHYRFLRDPRVRRFYEHHGVL